MPMILRRASCILVCASWLVAASSARAAGNACEAVALHADARAVARWPGLVAQLRAALDARSDLERCADVAVSVRDGAALLRVKLADGRTATREVSTVVDIVPALTALLIVATPEHATEGALAPPPSAARPPRPHDRRVSVTFLHDEPAAASSEPARTSDPLGFGVGIEAGARIGSRVVSGGLGALTLVRVGSWLIGVTGRLDGYDDVSGSRRPAPALGLGLVSGWRFRFNPWALDLTLGPSLVVIGASARESTTAPPNSSASDSRAGNAFVPRLAAAARVHLGADSTLHPFAGIDAELGPATGAAASQADQLVRLPVWTLGLALGAMLGSS